MLWAKDLWAWGSKSINETDIITPAANPKDADTTFLFFDSVKKIIMVPSIVESPAAVEIISANVVFWSKDDTS